MIRITTLLWVVLLVIAGGTVMHVSYQVRHVEQRLSELNRNTRLEQDKLRSRLWRRYGAYPSYQSASSAHPRLGWSARF